MSLPFSIEQFLATFERYNLAIWPLQIVAYALGLLAVLLTLRPRAHTDKIISTILVVFWLWTGVIYHLLFFAEIKPAAVLFGVASLGRRVPWPSLESFRIACASGLDATRRPWSEPCS